MMSVAVAGFVVCRSLHAMAETPEHPARLLATRSWEREQALTALTEERRSLTDVLMETLAEASKNHRADCRYHSPLHTAITAVQECAILDSTDLLLSMVDYELDPKTFPAGMDVPGSAFFPAAQALVRLRVGTTDVLRALAAADCERTCRILTWILLERAGDGQRAKHLLEKYAEQRHGLSEKSNCAAGLGFLEFPSEILPSPAASHEGQ